MYSPPPYISPEVHSFHVGSDAMAVFVSRTIYPHPNEFVTLSTMTTRTGSILAMVERQKRCFQDKSGEIVNTEL